MLRRDFSFLTKEELLALLEEQRRIIAELQRRVTALEEELKRTKSGGPSMPGTKPTKASPLEPKARQPRPQGFARRRLVPTEHVDHAVDTCPDCGTVLQGGWVQRTREVLELPRLPLRVIEHRYLARQCPTCRQRCVPAPALTDVVVGKQRLGVHLLSHIADQRMNARLPIRAIQRHLAATYGLALSVGGIVTALHGVAQRGAPAVAAIRDELRTSPVVHADETGWRQSGRNGYVWTLSTPTLRYFTRGTRQAVELDRVVGDAFTGTLTSDFYAGYDHYHGPHQRCWAHLLRAIHDLRSIYPEDAALADWATQVRAVFDGGRAVTSTSPRARHAAAQRLTAALRTLCQPLAADATAVARRLCKRILRYEAELFTFVRDPTVPPDNNAAERSLRPLVTQRKISGGTRSLRGTTTMMGLATLFGTWHVRGLDPLVACRTLLTSPHP